MKSFRKGLLIGSLIVASLFALDATAQVIVLNAGHLRGFVPVVVGGESVLVPVYTLPGDTREFNVTTDFIAPNCLQISWGTYYKVLPVQITEGYFGGIGFGPPPPLPWSYFVPSQFIPQAARCV